jgi:hypothetical protein
MKSLAPAPAATATAPAPDVLRRACDCGSATHEDEACPACSTQAPGVRMKPFVGRPDDPYEREADSVADRVVGGGAAPDAIRRRPEAGELQRQPEEEEEEPLQLKRDTIRRESLEEEEMVQAKAAGPAAPAAPAAPVAAAAVVAGGAPLSRADRAYFEPRFGRDLSHVRLHTDAAAGHAAQGIGARAYTLRHHIAFAPGQFSPATTEGRRLIAHELTHTFQQEAVTIRRAPFDRPGTQDDFGGPPRPREMEDPRGPGQSTLTYAQSRELTRCIKVMGDNDVARAECANTVLGTPIPEWKSVPGISSPVPFRAGVAASGEATTRIGPVALTILPDTTSTDAEMQNGAHTEITFAPLPAGTNLVDWVSHSGKVSSFTFNQDLFALTIQTTYGPGASAAGSSGYGRGTAKADKSTGQTSLGFHEGEHGRDFVEYLKNNAYPDFKGKTGQTTAVFRGHVISFQNAVSTYIKTMTRLSELRTDCAGKSIDKFHAEQGKATSMCAKKPGDPKP